MNNTVPEHINKSVDNLRAEALREIEGGKLFGLPINLNDNEMVIAALYVLLLAERIKNYGKLENRDQRLPGVPSRIS